MNKFAYMVVFCAFSAAMLQGALAAVYVVGDATGWTIPPNPATYSNWASGKTFRVGDILVFNFVTNAHDVLQVPKASYDGCSSNNAIGSMITTGPANVTLNSAGDHYYICTISGHCTAGQKLAISVSSASGSPGANPPTSSPAPPTPTTPSPPTPTTPSPTSNDACAPTPSQAPKADGPGAASPPAATTPPPPPPSSSNVMFASLGFAVASIAVGLFA